LVNTYGGNIHVRYQHFAPVFVVPRKSPGPQELGTNYHLATFLVRCGSNLFHLITLLEGQTPQGILGLVTRNQYPMKHKAIDGCL